MADPGLRRLAVSYLLFNLAEWAAWIAILVHAHAVGGAALVGVAAVVQLVPAAIGAPLLAGVADRLPRRRALQLGYRAQALTALATGAGILAGAPFGVVLAAAAVHSVLVATTRPAHSALIPEMADDTEQAVAANSVSGTMVGAAGLLGPLVAAILLGISSSAAVYLAMAAVLAVASMAVPGRVRRPLPPLAEPEGARVRLAARTPGVPGLLLVGSVQALVLGSLEVLVVVLAIETLGWGDAGVGYLGAVLGAGGLAGGLAAGALVGRSRLLRPLAGGSGAVGLPLVAMSGVGWGIALLPLTGFGDTFMDVTLRSMLQRAAPRASMARIFGLLESFATAAAAAGALAAPVLIGRLGTAPALLATGAALPLAVLAVGGRLARTEGSAPGDPRIVEVLGSVPTFAVLSAVQIEGLALGGSVLDVEAGAVVVREGEPGDSAFVVATGQLSVEASATRMAVLGPGDLFGEIALLADVPRTATVRALAATRLLEIRREAFLSVVESSPGVRVGLDRSVARRLRRVEEAAG